MERQEQGQPRTDDIASGGGEGRLPEREPGGAPPQQGGGASEGGQEVPGGQPGAAGYQPQSPDTAQGGAADVGGQHSGPQAQPADPHGLHPSGQGGVATEGAGAPAGQGGAATVEHTEGGGTPGTTNEGGYGEPDTVGGAPGQGAGAAATGSASGEGSRGGTGTLGGDGHGTGSPSQSAGGGAGHSGGGSTALLAENDASEFERRWQDVQVGFVDEPRRCVQEADSLVAEVMQHLADGFARERKDLEAQWAGGGEPSTEDLRVALQRYRSFFERLLKTS